MLESFLLLQQHHELKGHERGHPARAVARAAAASTPRSAAIPATASASCRCSAQPHLRGARAAAHEPVRRARPLPAGVRAHRRPDAARPLPRVHGRRAHPEGDPQPAALLHPGARARVSAVQPPDERFRAPRGALPRRRCSTTSPRAAAATTRQLGAADARRFGREHGLAARGHRARRLAGREPPGDVRHGAEAGHRRSRGDPGLRRARRRTSGT